MPPLPGHRAAEQPRLCECVSFALAMLFTYHIVEVNEMVSGEDGGLGLHGAE